MTDDAGGFAKAKIGAARKSLAEGARHLPLLLVGAVGGYAATATGVPLPWLIGAIVASAFARAVVVTPVPPKNARKTGQLLLGAAVALNLTPDVLKQIVTLAPFMAFAGVASIAVASGIAVLMARWSRIDRKTAYFACMPGGVAEMSNLADRYGGNAALVSLAQSLRIVTVVIAVPIAMHAMIGFGGDPLSAQQEADVDVLVLAPVVAVGFLVGVLFDRLGVLNSWFLGALAVAGTLSAADLISGHMPYPVSGLGQVLIGVSLGARLDLGEIARFRLAAPIFVGATLALIMLNAVFAAALSLLVPVDVWSMILALAPGGIAEMSITAEVLGAAVAIVTAFHLVRVILIVLLSAPIYAHVFSRLSIERGP